MQGIINPVFSSRQVQLHSTLKPVTPFGGLVSLIEFFNTLKIGEVLGRLMPLRQRPLPAIMKTSAWAGSLRRFLNPDSEVRQRF